MCVPVARRNARVGVARRRGLDGLVEEVVHALTQVFGEALGEVALELAGMHAQGRRMVNVNLGEGGRTKPCFTALPRLSAALPPSAAPAAPVVFVLDICVVVVFLW